MKMAKKPTDIELAVQKVTGMQPGLDRASLLFYYTDKSGRNHLSAPQFVYDAAKAFVTPGVAARGGKYDVGDVANMALNVTGAGLGASRVAGPTVRAGERVLGMGVGPKPPAQPKVAPKPPAKPKPAQKAAEKLLAAKYTVIHGGSDFDTIDPTMFGSGEPGRLRPLGKGLYGGLARSPEELQSAVELARVYANKYGRDSPTLHAFEADLPAEKVSKLGYSSERLPSGDQKYWTRTGEGPADWEAEALPWRHAEDAPTAIEISVANTDRLKRAGKWPADTSYEDILAALSAPGPAAQDLGAKYGLPEFTTDLTPAQIEANRATHMAGAKSPPVLYHGTPNWEGTAYNPNQPTLNRVNNNVAGFYADTDPESASGYALDAKTVADMVFRAQRGEKLDPSELGYGPSSQVLPVHVAIKNPFVPGNSQVTKPMLDAYAAELKAANPHLGGGLDNWVDSKVKNFANQKSVSITALDGDGMAYQRVLKAGGYDGLNDGTAWIAFEPTQIKSTMNRGTFDPNEPNLSKARGGLVEKYAEGGPVVRNPATLKAYKPSLRERAQIGMEGLYTRATGREPGYAPRRLMGKASELLEFAPGVGDVIGIDETKRALDRRQYLEAGLTGAGTMLGVFPVFGDAAGKALKGAAKPAQQAAEKLAAKYGTAAAEPLTAYHGSPHKFDRFDMSKLRTGEGQNVYGEGLYLAEHPDVAKAYREALAGPASGGSVTFRNRPIVTKGAPGGSWGMELLDADLKPRDVAADLLRNYGKVEDTIAQYRNYATEQRSRWASGLEGDVPGVGSNVSASGREALRRLTLESADTHDRMANFLEKYGQDFKVRAPGYTYEVGIKAEPEQFMDWDKPLSEQSKLVQSGLGDFAEQRAARANAARAELLARGVQGGRPLTPQRIAELSVRVLPEETTGQRLYNMTAIDLGALKAGDKGAETRRKLLDLGIAGNRYRDQGSRSGIGLGTHNYVVFDDELLNIKDRYAEGGPVVPGNIDLHNRPVVRNADDSISTVLSITVGFGDKTYVLPRVVGGKVVSNQEAIDHFRQTGEHLGAYDKQKDAEDYSQRLHEEQAKEYKSKARGGLVKKYGV
jgi:hypothetical protein